MFSENRIKLLILVCVVLLIAATGMSSSRRVQRLATGSWGGMHIRLAVEQGAATIDYDCASGTIDGPLTISRNGRFSWRGTHTRERGGPIRMDEQSNGQSALYTGWVKGDTMTLTVRLADNNEVIATYTLKRGSTGRVFKCK